MAGERNSRTRTLLAGVALTILILLVYSPIRSAGFLWDDVEYITENPALRDADGLRRIWSEPGATPQYYPLVFTSFWLELRVWRESATGYHVVSVLLHAASVVLLVQILRKLGVPGAWYAGALFAIHPVMVESVAWVSERKNVLSTLFYLLSIRAYLGFRNLGGDRQPVRPRLAYGLCLVAFAAALLTKSATCTLPVALLILIWFKTGRVSRKDCVALLPHMALALAAAICTTWMETRHIGATGPRFELPAVARALIAARAIWFYVGKLIWPAGLAFIYPRWTPSTGSVRLYVGAIGLVLIVAALWVLRRRIGRGPFAAVAFFIISLAPTLGFINFYYMQFSFVADHFQYLASLGLFAAAGTGFAKLLARTRIPRFVTITLGAAALVALSVTAYRQCVAFADPRVLFSRTLAVNPDSAYAHSAMGFALQQRGQFEEAMSAYAAALRATPLERTAIYNFGGVSRAAGRLRDALQVYKACEELEPQNEHVQYMYGTVEAWSANFGEALRHYDRAVELQPRFAGAHSNAAGLLMQQGRFAESIPRLRAALQVQPEYFDARVQLAAAYDAVGQSDDAVACYRAAIGLRPSDIAARTALTDLLVRLGRLDDAHSSLMELRIEAARSGNTAVAAEADEGLQALDAARRRREPPRISPPASPSTQSS